MAIKTYYLGSGQDGNYGALFDGTAQTAASRADGWTVAKIASTNASDFDAATKQVSGTFAAATGKPAAIITGATANAFKTPAALSGTFANTSWAFTFAVRAVTLSAQAGRIRMRVYRSVNADGSGATEITGATQVGTTSSVLSTTADVTTVVTWSPGATIDLNNEYLFFTLAWEITTAGGSNSADVVLRTGSTGPAGTRLVTPDFVPAQTIAVGSRAATTTVRGVTLVPGPVTVLVGRCAAATTVRGVTPQSAVVPIGKVVGGLTYAGAVAADAPVVYYRFNETSGTVAVDEISAKNGTINGSPALGQTGPIAGNTAIQFDGSDDSVTLPSSVSIPTGSSITVEWWQYVATADVRASAAFAIGNDASAAERLAAHAPWSDKVLYWDYGSSTTTARVTTDYTPYLDNWTHVALTYDSATNKHAITLNGAEVASAISAITPVATMAGGTIAWSSWGFFKARMDEFAIYNYALTPTQRLAHYNARTGAGGTVTRGVTPVTSVSDSTLPIGQRAAATTARGVTLAPAGAAPIAVGSRTAATTVRGVTLAPGVVTLVIGSRAAATTTRGVTLTGTGAAPLLVGRKVAATLVRGIRLGVPFPVADYTSRWDSADLGSLTFAGGFIHKINDVGSPVNDMTGAPDPEYGARLMNGIITPDYGGVTPGAMQAPLVTSQTVKTVFIVALADSIGGVRPILGGDQAGGFEIRVVDGTVQLVRNGVTTIVAHPTPIVPGVPFIVSAVVDG